MYVLLTIVQSLTDYGGAPPSVRQVLVDVSAPGTIDSYVPHIRENDVHWANTNSDGEIEYGDESQDGSQDESQDEIEDGTRADGDGVDDTMGDGPDHVDDDAASYSDVDDDPEDVAAASKLDGDPADMLVAYRLAKTFFRDFVHDLKAVHAKGGRQATFSCTDKWVGRTGATTSTVDSTLDRLVTNSFYPGGLRPSFGHRFIQSVADWAAARPDVSKLVLAAPVSVGDVLMVVLESRVLVA